MPCLWSLGQGNQEPWPSPGSATSPWVLVAKSLSLLNSSFLICKIIATISAQGASEPTSESEPGVAAKGRVGAKCRGARPQHFTVYVHGLV